MFRVEEASQKYHVYPFSAPQDKALSDIPAPGAKPSATGPRSALEDIKLMRYGKILLPTPPTFTLMGGISVLHSIHMTC
jgi:hypothetical protein